MLFEPHRFEGTVETSFPDESYPQLPSSPAPFVPTINHQRRTSPCGKAGVVHVYVPVVPIEHVPPDTV